MPSYVLLDGSGNILEAYNGPYQDAPAGSIEIADDLYSQIPLRLTGWTYTAVNGSTPASVSAPAQSSPPPTLAQQAQAAIMAGLTIALTGSITLAATVFPTDPDTQTKLTSVILTINTEGTFPGGATSYPMKDMAGAWHTFTIAQYKAVAGAIAAYAAPLYLIADGNPLSETELPSSSVTLTV